MNFKNGKVIVKRGSVEERFLSAHHRNGSNRHEVDGLVFFQEKTSAFTPRFWRPCDKCGSPISVELNRFVATPDEKMLAFVAGKLKEAACNCERKEENG